MIPIVEHAVTLAAATKRLRIMVGSAASTARPSTWHTGAAFVALVQRAHMQSARVLEAGTIGKGSIEKGKYADLVAMPGDPLADITAVGQIGFVMKGGLVVRYDLDRRPVVTSN